MYKMFVDGVLFHDSTLDFLQIESGTITRELNKAGSFKFSIYPDHPHYNLIQELKSLIEVYKDGRDEPIFRGRALYPEIDFYNKKTYTCEGHFNFLLDSVQRKYTLRGTVADLFAMLIENHNSQVEEYKRFSVGNVTVEDDTIKFSDTAADATQTVMKKQLIDAFGGYVVPRLTDGVWYLDYLADFETRGTQTIEFGENLTKFTRKNDFSNIITAFIPYASSGGTIAKYNNGSDMLIHETGVSLYGMIVGTKVFNDVKYTSKNLYNLATEYLNNIVKQKIVLEMNAIDLSMFDKSIESFNLGDYVRVISEPHRLDDWFLISKQTVNLTDPTKDSVVLGDTFETFTAQTAGVNSVVKTIDNSIETAVSESPTIQSITEKVDALGEGLPSVTTDDNGKILKVVNGAWVAGTTTVPYTEEPNAAGGTTVTIGDEVGGVDYGR